MVYQEVSGFGGWIFGSFFRLQPVSPASADTLDRIIWSTLKVTWTVAFMLGSLALTLVNLMNEYIYISYPVVEDDGRAVAGDTRAGFLWILAESSWDQVLLGSFKISTLWDS